MTFHNPFTQDEKQRIQQHINDAGEAIDAQPAAQSETKKNAWDAQAALTALMSNQFKSAEEFQTQLAQSINTLASMPESFALGARESLVQMAAEGFTQSRSPDSTIREAAAIQRAQPPQPHIE